MRMPEDFVTRMERLLKDEAEDFFKSFDEPLHIGMHVNTLKISVEKFKEIVPFELKQVPWCSDGFYVVGTDGQRPGKHPYYHCGLYYLQEPSAMIPANVLSAEKGDRVLDMCAAPGGKSVQIGARLDNSGMLLANDINPKRTVALCKNIQAAGIYSAVVTNAKPESLAVMLKGYFNKILIDAPCSGEGMLKKDSGTFEADKSLYHRQQCDILDQSSAMLDVGGRLVYSTCTFAPEENEVTIEKFIKTHPEFKLLNIEMPNLSPGVPEWTSGNPELSKTKRLWPHRAEGEGHFVALLEKTDTLCYNEKKSVRLQTPSPIPECYAEFVREYGLTDRLTKNLYVEGNLVFIMPEGLPDLTMFKRLCTGVCAGEIKNGRFLPDQALASFMSAADFPNRANFSADDVRASKYLKGETVDSDDVLTKGWCLVTIDGFPAGWGRYDQGTIKNGYKKQWRMM